MLAFGTFFCIFGENMYGKKEYTIVIESKFMYS